MCSIYSNRIYHLIVTHLSVKVYTILKSSSFNKRFISKLSTNFGREFGRYMQWN